MNDLLTKHLKSTPLIRGIKPKRYARLRPVSAAVDGQIPTARPQSVDDFLREFRMIRVFRTAPVDKS